MRSWENKAILFSMFLIFFLFPHCLFLCSVLCCVKFKLVWFLLQCKILYAHEWSNICIILKLLMNIYIYIYIYDHHLVKKIMFLAPLTFLTVPLQEIFLPEEMITLLISVITIPCLFILLCIYIFITLVWFPWSWTLHRVTHTIYNYVPCLLS